MFMPESGVSSTSRRFCAYARCMRTREVFEDGPTATAGGWRSTAAWLGVLVLACGRPDDGQAPSRPASVAASDEDEPAAPGPSAEPAVASGWALDPATGECGPYANQGAEPDGGLRFDSEIECRCSIESCPSTIQEAEQSLCGVTSPQANVQRFLGCGLVVVLDLTGYWWTFQQPRDSATLAPRLVGAARLSEASSLDAGSAWSWGAGLDPGTCDYGPTSICQLCGDDPATDYPPCE
jgi:hypothetical protein